MDLSGSWQIYKGTIALMQEVDLCAAELELAVIESAVVMEALCEPVSHLG